MKKKHKCSFGVFLIAIILFIISSCSVDKKNKKIEDDFTNYRIDVDYIKNSCDSFIKSAKFIPLELNDESVLNGIDKLIYTKENLIVFDKRQKQVVVFDTLGVFHSKIRKYGKGPNEYLFPTDIIFDKNENELGIMAQSKGCIIWFNLDGSVLSTNYIKREKLLLSQALMRGNQIFHFIHNPKTGNNPYQINSTDIELKKINYSTFKSNPNQISNLHLHPFGVFENNITLHLPFDQYIYKYVQEKTSKLFYFDFKDRNLPENLLAKMMSLENNETYEQIQSYNKEIRNFVKVTKIIPLKDFIFLEISYKYQRFCVLVNILDNTSHVFRSNLGGFSFAKYVGCISDNNTVLFEISPTQINKYKSSKITNPEIIEKEDSSSLINNNPWILKVQF